MSFFVIAAIVWLIHFGFWGSWIGPTIIVGIWAGSLLIGDDEEAFQFVSVWGVTITIAAMLPACMPMS